jgi:hypothetical protein
MDLCSTREFLTSHNPVIHSCLLEAGTREWPLSMDSISDDFGLYVLILYHPLITLCMLVNAVTKYSVTILRIND